MAVSIKFGVELTFANGTSEFLFSAVDLHVLHEICSLCEAVSTFRNLTYIRSLLGMNPEMVKEVVPFSKDLTAVLVSTREQSDDPS